MALASARTNSTIGTLGESIRNVASTARQLGVEFTDVVAGVALLQDVGLDASVAGSAMNTMLTKLAKPPASVARQMRRMGLSFKDAQGNMLAFPKVLEVINEAAKRSGGNFDQVAFLADLVGLRGQKAAANLGTLFESGKFSTLAKELEQAEGKAAEMAGIRMDTLQGDFLLFGSAVDGMKQRLFSLEGGPMRDVVQRTTEWVAANEDLIVSKVGEFLQDVRTHLPEIVKWLKRIGVALGVFFALSAAVKVATVAVQLFKGALFIAKGVKIAYTAATKLATLAQARFALSTGASRKALVGMRMAALASMDGLAGLRGSLNAGALGSSINGVTSKLGKAGLLGAALAVGFSIGSWLDHKFKISEMVSGWMADFDGLNSVVAKTGEFLGFDALEDIGKGLMARNKDLREIGRSNVRGTGLNPQATGATAPGPQLASPQEAVARSVSESISMQKEQVDIRIKDETGRAEVKRTRPGSGASLRMQPSGGI